jgi:hypothetical protein
MDGLQTPSSGDHQSHGGASVAHSTMQSEAMVKLSSSEQWAEIPNAVQPPSAQGAATFHQAPDSRPRLPSKAEQPERPERDRRHLELLAGELVDELTRPEVVQAAWDALGYLGMPYHPVVGLALLALYYPLYHEGQDELSPTLLLCAYLSETGGGQWLLHQTEHPQPTLRSFTQWCWALWQALDYRLWRWSPLTQRWVAPT